MSPVKEAALAGYTLLVGMASKVIDKAPNEHEKGRRKGKQYICSQLSNRALLEMVK